MNYNNICPVCENSEKLNSFSWCDYKVIHCNNCGLDYCSQMTEKELGGDSSPVHMEGIEMMANTLYTTAFLTEKFVKKRVLVYEKLLNRKCENILEVGCGPGVFYNPFKKKSIKWNGIDINPYWKFFGEKNNIPISNQPLDSIKQKYDVIIAFQVLEHVENPISFMSSLLSKLKPGGVIHLELPNHNSLNSRIRRISPLISYDYGFIQPPMHLRAYQKSTIEYLFEKMNINSKIVFVCGNNNSSWGQVRNYSYMQKTLYSFSDMIGLGSLLIGIGQVDK